MDVNGSIIDPRNPLNSIRVPNSIAESHSNMQILRLAKASLSKAKEAFMRKGSTGQESPADFIGNDNADQVGQKAIGPDENEYTSKGKNKAANKLANTGKTSPARRPRQKWLREIAKMAASARWQRGD